MRRAGNSLTPCGLAARARFFQRVVPREGADYRGGMSRRLAAALCASLVLLPVSACGQKPVENQSVEAPGEPAKGVDRSHAGTAMPEVQLFNADEEQAPLGEASGKPLLVNLWASWCAPCVKELPTLDALSRRPGSPKILAVSEDIGERPSVEAFLDKHGIRNLETWRDPKMALSGALGVQVMPTTIYYDATGHEIWRYTGDLDWTSEEAAKLLGEGAAAKR